MYVALCVYIDDWIGGGGVNRLINKFIDIYCNIFHFLLF